MLRWTLSIVVAALVLARVHFWWSIRRVRRKALASLFARPSRASPSSATIGAPVEVEDREEVILSGVPYQLIVVTPGFGPRAFELRSSESPANAMRGLYPKSQDGGPPIDMLLDLIRERDWQDQSGVLRRIELRRGGGLVVYQPSAPDEPDLILVRGRGSGGELAFPWVGLGRARPEDLEAWYRAEVEASRPDN